MVRLQTIRGAALRIKHPMLGYYSNIGDAGAVITGDRVHPIGAGAEWATYAVKFPEFKISNHISP